MGDWPDLLGTPKNRRWECSSQRFLEQFYQPGRLCWEAQHPSTGLNRLGRPFIRCRNGRPVSQIRLLRLIQTILRRSTLHTIRIIFPHRANHSYIPSSPAGSLVYAPPGPPLTHSHMASRETTTKLFLLLPQLHQRQ